MGGGDEANIYICRLNGHDFFQQISLDLTVRSLKEAISQYSGISPDQQLLLFHGSVLNDDETLRSHGLGYDNVVTLIHEHAPASKKDATCGVNGTNNASHLDSDGGFWYDDFVHLIHEHAPTSKNNGIGGINGTNNASLPDSNGGLGHGNFVDLVHEHALDSRTNATSRINGTNNASHPDANGGLGYGNVVELVHEHVLASRINATGGINGTNNASRPNANGGLGYHNVVDMVHEHAPASRTSAIGGINGTNNTSRLDANGGFGYQNVVDLAHEHAPAPRTNATGLQYGNVDVVHEHAPASRTNAIGGINGTNNASPLDANGGENLVGASGLVLNGDNGSNMNVSFGSGDPNIKQMRQPYLLNSDLMKEVMNTPAMRSFLNYPDTLRSIIKIAPRMQAKVDQNPLIEQILSDPSSMHKALQNFASCMLDPTWLNQINQHPNSPQMVRMLPIISNLRLLNQIISANAGLRGMPNITFQFLQRLQDPEFLLMMSSLEISELFLTHLQMVLSHMGQRQSIQDSGQAGRAIAVQDTQNSSIRSFDRAQMETSNMLLGLEVGSQAVPNRSYNEPPELLYADQLLRLHRLSFLNTEDNIRALVATSGNVQAAVKWLEKNSGW